MGFLDEVAGAVPYRKKQYVIEVLGQEADEFLQALADPKVQPTAIFHALRRRGIDVSERAVTYWARDART